jgi:D-alanine-D-alanine ligase
MDKVASKRIFIRNAVPTCDYVVLEEGFSLERATAQARALGYPLVCKPAVGGSSIGVAVTRAQDEFVRYLRDASRSEQRAPRNAALGGLEAKLSPAMGRVLVERYVPGRELTVGILDGEPLPVIEIRHRRELFDYRAKYSDGSTRYVLPVAILETLYRKAQQVSARACECLGCRHFARVDLIYGYDGNLYVLEVNTIPGFTPRSLLPMAARYAGTGFAELCERIARMALRDAAAAAPYHLEAQRHRRRTA